MRKILTFEDAYVGVVVWDTDYEPHMQKGVVVEIDTGDESILVKNDQDGGTHWYYRDEATYGADDDYIIENCLEYEATRVISRI